MPPLPRSAVIWKRPIVLPVSSSLPARTVGSFAGSSTIALLICVARILRAVVFAGILKNAEKICRWKLWYLIGLFANEDVVMRNMVIIGSGPAGLTAAVYSARANLQPLLIEGKEPGGQLTLTTLVENYPGFADGIMGPQLMEDMRKQSQRFGAEVVNGFVHRVDFDQYPFRVYHGEEEIQAKTVII